LFGDGLSFRGHCLFWFVFCGGGGDKEGGMKVILTARRERGASNFRGQITHLNVKLTPISHLSKVPSFPTNDYLSPQ
jgi:hypothetical protein